MSLRLRLGLVFTLATAAVIAVVGIGFLLQLRASLDATLDVGLRARAATIEDQYASGGPASTELSQSDQPVQLVTRAGQVVASSPGLDRAPVIDQNQRQGALRDAAAGTDPLAFTTGPDDERTRYLATALPDRPGPGPHGLLLVVGDSAEVSDTADEHVEIALLALGPPAIVAAGFGAWWLAGAALRPVERMRRQTAEISEHDSTAHLAVPATRDEIAALGHTMNGLLDRLRGALEHERGFVADASHELRTPLATLRAELELADRPGRSTDELRTAVTSARAETERLIRLAEQLLLLARSQSDAPFLRSEVVDLTDVVAASARHAAVGADTRDIDIVVDGPHRLELHGDGDRLRQVIDNLVANAVRHSPDHRAVTVTLSVDDSAGTASVGVADDGPGFPADFLPHVFERFRRADSARARADGGNGLGLAIVDAIVRAHHGQVTASNRPEGGALLRVTLPVAGAAPGTDRPTDRTGARPGAPPSPAGGRDPHRVPSAAAPPRA